jgi:predicted DCC family thiol-disulfide oxidoreductase YuxK
MPSSPILAKWCKLWLGYWSEWNPMAKTVVVYDGLCGLCTQSVWLIKRLDWLRRLEYLDAQDWPTVHARFPQLDQDAILGQIHMVTPDGRIYVGYEGMRRIIRYFPLVFWLYPLLFLPGITWLGPKVYQWIAAHRYQISRRLGHPVSCENGTCKIHRPAQARQNVGD